MAMNPKHIKILLSFELKQSFKSAPSVLAALFLFLPLAWFLSKLYNHASLINDFASGNISQEQTFLLGAAKWMAGMDKGFVDRLFMDHSPFVTLMFVMTVFAVPFLTMIAALDQNASDIGSKGIRFLLPRTSRDNLLVGRFLGTMTSWSAMLILSGIAVTITALILDDVHGASVVISDGIWFTVSIILVATPFAAFMALCSVVTGNPLLSITMGIGSYLGVFLLGGLGGWIHSSLKLFRFLFPAPLRYDLMLGDMTKTSVAMIAMIAYSLAFLILAGLFLRKRDL